MFNSFLTGSHVYGRPTKESDVDLVLLVDYDTAEFLRKHSKLKKEPVRYGNLNLIICETVEEYMAWYMGTKKAENLANSGRPEGVSKEWAKDIIDKFRKELGVQDKGQSGS